MSLADVENPTHSHEETNDLVDSVSQWRHRVPVGHGIVTAGYEDTIEELKRLGLPPTLSGRRVLDIGCSDGYYSFVCEGRGAEVVAVDNESSLLADGRRNGFQVAQALRNSSTRYEVQDVHALDPAQLGLFDVVLFVNVLYHVENPMLALQRIASVTRPGGTLILKTYYRTDVRVWRRGRCFGFDIGSRPKWWFFPTIELGGDPTNWWAPNRPGLLALLEATGWVDATVTNKWQDRLYVHATRASTE